MRAMIQKPIISASLSLGSVCSIVLMSACTTVGTTDTEVTSKRGACAPTASRTGSNILRKPDCEPPSDSPEAKEEAQRMVEETMRQRPLPTTLPKGR